MITRHKPTSWKDLQNKVGEILKNCGFEVEVEKKIASARGIVEIDVFAEEQIKGRKYSILCECKYWGTNIPQTIIHGFRTVVNDIGSNVGYIITTSKFQSGAKETSNKTNIELLTWVEFQDLFFESWYAKYFYKTINQDLNLTEDYFLVSWFDDLNQEDKRLYSQVKNRLSEIFEIQSYFPMPYLNELKKEMFPIPKLPIGSNLFKFDNYFGEVPDDILKEEYYQEFLSKFLTYAKQVTEDFNNISLKYRIKYQKNNKNV